MSKKGGFFNRTPHWKKSRGGWGSEAIIKIVKKQKPHKNKKLHKGNKIIAHDCTLQGSLSCCCSGPKSCPAVCNPIDCSTQASLSLTISQSLPKFMSIELMMLSNHLILCHLLLLQSFLASGSFSMSWVFTSGSQIIRASTSASVLPVGLTGLISLLSKEIPKYLGRYFF